MRTSRSNSPRGSLRRTGGLASLASLWLALACGPAPDRGATPTAPTAAEPDTVAPRPSTKTQAPPAAAPVPAPPAEPEALAIHMRDHVDLATQARDALIRGQREAAEGALTFIAQHREPNASPDTAPFHARLSDSAKRAIDAADLPAAAKAVAELGAACGDCHARTGHGPRPEPSGFEDLDQELTVASHMHGYLWASDRLWDALLSADDALWQVGVSTLAALTPPSRPKKLRAGFAAIRAWAKDAASRASSEARAAAYGTLVSTCAACHLTEGVDPGANPRP